MAIILKGEKLKDFKLRFESKKNKRLKIGKIKKKRVDNTFREPAHYALLQPAFSKARVQVCHGFITNPNGDRVKHAWIESKGYDGKIFVFDFKFDYHWYREGYYASKDPTNVRKYGKTHLRKLIDKHGHYGPFVEDL